MRKIEIDWPRVDALLAQGKHIKDIAEELGVAFPTFERQYYQRRRERETPAEVYTSAVGEFDRLPEGYATAIQPMRPYSEAEETALQESMRLYGFLGAIVMDQYGRILDGHHRQRIARLRGLGVPYTITQVKDDAHAIEIARTANVVRRHYTQQQREEIAPILRDQGFSYRAIAEALGVSHTQARADVEEGTPTGERLESTLQSPAESPETEGGLESTFQSGGHEPPPKRVNRKGGKGTYPAKRPSTPKPREAKPRTISTRMQVQEGLVASLQNVPDDEAWDMLSDLSLSLLEFWNERDAGQGDTLQGLMELIQEGQGRGV